MILLPVGIDPGTKGGCALVNPPYVLFHKTAQMVPHQQYRIESIDKAGPDGPDDVGRKVNVYNSDAVITILRGCRDTAIEQGKMGIAIFMEEPISMQNTDSHKSYISMGRCLQSWEFAANKLSIPFYVVNPRHWKSCLKLSGDKQKSLDLAVETYPTLPEAIRKDDNLCEAALLGLWAILFRPDLLNKPIG